MEEILKQLLLQRAQQTLAQSAQEDAAFQQQLQQTKVARSQAALQRAGIVVSPHGNATRSPEDMVQRRSAEGGMPVFDKNDELNRTLQANDLMATVERGQPVEPYMLQGLRPEEMAGALGMGGQMRALGGDPSFSHMTQPSPQQQDLVYRPPEDNTLERDQLRREKAALVDQHVQKHGYSPGLFEDMTAEEAAALIADQLQARRAAQGDPWAFAAGPNI